MLPIILALATLALAANRVFENQGDTPCQACLAKVEAKCRGPTSSDQFNDCFCAVGEDSDAWQQLKGCLTSDDGSCKEFEYNVLSYWGSHCFAYKDDEEEIVCVDSTEDDKILMSVADSFCTEFLTLTTESTSATTDSTTVVSTETSTEATETEETTQMTSTTESVESTASTAPETSSTDSSADTGPNAGDSGSGSGSGDNGSDNNGDDESSSDDSDDNDDGVGALSPLSFAGAGLVAICVSGFVMNLL